nr:hypothetical protein BaRGS_006032 [Batillaria attramentaria]
MTRLIFHAARVPFVDRRLTSEEWKDFKPKTPMGMLPVLETPDGMFCESGAIARWAARKFGLYGKTDSDELMVEAIVTQGQELREKQIIPLMFEKDPETKEEKKKKALEEVEKVLNWWEKNVVQTPSTEKTYSYTVGHQLTAGDLALLDVSENLQRLIQLDMSRWPRLIAVINTVSALPGLKEYLAEREKMTFVV